MDEAPAKPKPPPLVFLFRLVFLRFTILVSSHKKRT